MPPRLRKLVLTVHIATSVGWLGAVAAYLALDVTAVTSEQVELVRAAYRAMELTVTSAIVPLAVASVLVGIVNALGTPWGLFRHYWVLVKLVLTLAATAVLLVEAPRVRGLADAAAAATDPRDLPGTLAHSVGGLVVLLTVLALSTYKPRGVTGYERKRRRRDKLVSTVAT
ncbi:MAG: DUF2269 domain-containing protein [Streptosporangiales bacterium]|nr:DUF2269 domain-containing protein [Streptosporangiales bacterium]